MDLTPLFETPDDSIALNLAGVTEMSSVGVKKWVDAIRELQTQNKRIEYQECPELFIDQCNMVSELHEGVEIASFTVTFECEECDEYVTETFITKDLDLEDLPPSVLCPSCQDPMIPENEEVFEFLEP